MEAFLEDSAEPKAFKQEQALRSVNDGGNSNAILLPAKKKNKKKGMSQQLKTQKNPKLTKSQKRKLKKLEEEKEKALLLSKSIETLEKYKIQEDVYSLLWSSRNIGQAETLRERRRRVMQFSKAGLSVPDADQPFKTGINSSCEIQPHLDESQLRLGLDENDFLQPSTEREIISEIHVCMGSSKEPVCSSGFNAVGKSGVTVQTKEDGNNSRDTCLQQDAQGSLQMTTSDYGSKVSIDESPKRHLSNTSSMADSSSQRLLSAPVVVPVSRPEEVENKRKDLPIVMMEQEIMEAINENITVIICGETGCGKTTQVPQFLYEAGFGSGQSSFRNGIIGVTQPRRVAVLATAKRVAFELDLRLGKEVGFQVRHDRRIGDNCSIKFMTDGILLREVQSDFLLRKYSIIIWMRLMRGA
ncbi:RNA helicase [Bertholletia excelsa]